MIASYIKRGSAFALFLLVSFLLVGKSIDFHFLTHFINGGDTYEWINFTEFLHKGLFVWENSETGRVSSMLSWSFFPNLILFLINIILPNPLLSINVFWILLLTFYQLSFYLFYRLFLNKKNAVLGTILSVFNLYFLITFHTPVLHNIIGLFSFPLSFFLFYRFVTKEKTIYLLFYAIFQLFLFRELNLLILINFLIPLIVYILRYRNNSSITRNKFIIQTFKVWIFSFLVALPLTINTAVMYLTGSLSNSATASYNQSALDIFQYYTVLNILRFTPNYGFLNKLPEMPGVQSFFFSHIFLDFPTLEIVTFIPLYLFILSFFYYKKNSFSLLVFQIFVIIFVLIAKTTNPPFAYINDLLYQNSVFLLFFRSGANYFMYLLIPLLVLCIFLSGHRYQTYFLTFIYTVCCASVILIFGAPVNFAWNSTLPAGYLEAAQKIDLEFKNDRALIVPITSHFSGYTDYLDGYSGPDRLYTLSGEDFLTKTFDVIMPDSYINSIEAIRTNPSDINTQYNVLDYRYLIVEKDSVSSEYHKVDDYRDILSKIDTDIWSKWFENSNFIIFKVKDNLFLPKLRISVGQLMFDEINPTKYAVELNNINNTADLTFMETFNKDWEVYILPKQSHSIQDQCLDMQTYARGDDIECDPKEQLDITNDFQLLFSKSIFEPSHINISNSYAQQWSINSQYIKQNFSDEYYSENPDGSINLKLVLFYKPQSYYEIGWIISILFILGGIGFSVFQYFVIKK